MIKKDLTKLYQCEFNESQNPTFQHYTFGRYGKVIL